MTIPTFLPTVAAVAVAGWGDAEQFIERLKDTSGGAGEEAWGE